VLVYMSVLTGHLFESYMLVSCGSTIGLVGVGRLEQTSESAVCYKQDKWIYMVSKNEIYKGCLRAS